MLWGITSVTALSLAELPSTLTSSVLLSYFVVPTACASDVFVEPAIAATFGVESGMILPDGKGGQRLAVCRAQPFR